MNAGRFIVTGTDTDVGKTVFAAALAGSLGAAYWKPVQAGTDAAGMSDTQRAQQLGAQRVLPEVYCLKTPCSPHQAAMIEGVTIEPDRLAMPQVAGPLVIEGAGGVLVPLSRDLLYADMFARWGIPVILAARTSLGTINHSLLSNEALRARGIAVHGIAFIGDENDETESAICGIGNVRRLGRLPMIENLNAATLAAAFSANFRTDNFA